MAAEEKMLNEQDLEELASKLGVPGGISLKAGRYAIGPFGESQEIVGTRNRLQELRRGHGLNEIEPLGRGLIEKLGLSQEEADFLDDPLLSGEEFPTNTFIYYEDSGGLMPWVAPEHDAVQDEFQVWNQNPDSAVYWLVNTLHAPHSRLSEYSGLVVLLTPRSRYVRALREPRAGFMELRDVAWGLDPHPKKPRRMLVDQNFPQDDRWGHMFWLPKSNNRPPLISGA